MLTLVYLFLFLLFLNPEAKLDNNIVEPIKLINHQIFTSRIVTLNKQFLITFPDPNFQLTGQVYESNTLTNESSLYTSSIYEKSKSCRYYRSFFTMNPIKKQQFNFIAEESLIIQNPNRLFLIASNSQQQKNSRFLMIYSYFEDQVQFVKNLTFQGTKLTQKREETLVMASLSSKILFMDGKNIYSLKNDFNLNNLKFQLVSGVKTGVQNINEQFLGIKVIYFMQKELLLVLYTDKIILYEYFKESNSVTLFIIIEKPSAKNFQDIQVTSSALFALSGNLLYEYKSQDLKIPILHELDGSKCTKIFIYQEIFHIICQYDKQNFVAELFFDQFQNKLILNRYYTDIQNYRNLYYINNYMIMVGQDQIILVSNAVNRKVLLEAPSNIYQQKFASFALQSIFILHQNKIKQNHTILAIGENYLTLFQLQVQLSQIWCEIKNIPLSRKTNLLVVRNTTRCQLNSKNSLISSTCQNLYPIQLTFQRYQLQEKQSTFLAILLLLIVFVFALLCMGCVFKQNSNYNQLVYNIKQKMKKMKGKQRELKEI